MSLDRPLGFGVTGLNLSLSLSSSLATFLYPRSPLGVSVARAVSLALRFAESTELTAMRLALLPRGQQ